jgi:hypothetical protein
VGDKELNFEASGALMDASLVMRDRETDSWWSIMTSDAIGGELNGADLVELPKGEKTTWKDWRQRHPDTLVLSVGGEEHVENNPYDNYLASEGTFRDLKIEDHRLAPKDSIYSFWWGDEPYAVPHTTFAGGKVLEVEGWEDKRLLLYRGKEASIFESTQAWVVPATLATETKKTKDLLALVRASDTVGAEQLSGFDTFWYNWVSVNEDTHLVK